jgi:hypothetical protein
LFSKKGGKFKGTFAGIGVGNAAINSRIQVQSYRMYLLQSGSKVQVSKAALASCDKLLKRCNAPWPFGGLPSCVAARNFCGTHIYDAMARSNHSLVDIRKTCRYMYQHVPSIPWQHYIHV